MKLALSVTGDIVNAMRTEILAGEKAVTTAMRAAGSNLTSNGRNQRGKRVSNSRGVSPGDSIRPKQAKEQGSSSTERF